MIARHAAAGTCSPILPRSGAVRRSLRIALFLAVLALPALLHAQTPSKNAAYVELGGSGIVPSVNYERRVSEAWFGRVGFSIVTSESSDYQSDQTDHRTSFVVPLTVSKMTHPEANHHLEFGGGVTIAGGDRQDLYDVGDTDHERFSTAFVTGLVGYRYQKPAGGFQFRAVFTPVAGAGDLLPWAGVSFGYAW